MPCKFIPAEQYNQKLKARDNHLVTLDVRTHKEYDSEHIESSIHIPLHQLSMETLRKEMGSEALSDASKIYILCQGGIRAQKAEALLREDCPAELYVIEGGLNQLKRCDIALTGSGKTVMSIERQVRIVAGFLVCFGVVMSFLSAADWVYLSGAVGFGLIFAGVTDTCAMAILLAKMPWNTR